MSKSKSNFIQAEDDIHVYVEHGDFGEEASTFIDGIASDAWYGDVDPEDKEYYKKMNPTLRFWKKHERPKKPDIHVTKRSVRFVPPPSECLLGPEAQYDVEHRGQHSHRTLKRHPGCRCARCTGYNYQQYWGPSPESNSSDNFWTKISGAIQIEV